MSKRTTLVLLGAYTLFSGAACRHAPPEVAAAGTPSAGAPGGDPELELLERAASWPGAEDALVLSLMGHYTAVGRDRDAHRFFQAQASARPERGLFLALAALFRVRLAGEVGLLDRVAWGEEAIAMLDRAVAVDPGVSRVMRGLVLAQLPAPFQQAQRAADELTFLLESGASPLHPARITLTAAFGLRRAGWQALAQAYRTLDRPERATAALQRAGAGAHDGAGDLLATPFSVSGAEGFRFSPPRIWSPGAEVLVATGYDFGDIAFIGTGDGVIAIDAGTTVDHARRAWQAVSARFGGRSIRTVIVTHGHWDHAGGLAAYQGPGVEVIAHAAFPAVLARSGGAAVGYRYFFGATFEPAALAAARPTRLVSGRTELHIGGLDLVLHPARGGETEDALLVELPRQGLVFVGDVFMPYLGAPFVGEGSLDGLLDTIATLEKLQARKLVHGHPQLTDLFTADALPALAPALRALEQRVLAGVAAGRSVAEMQSEAWLPDHLATAPRAVLGYLVMRENAIARLQRARTGYWQPDGAGLHPHRKADWNRALDLLAGGDEDRFRAAAERLAAGGQLALALELSDAGLAAHRDSAALADLRRQILDRLRAKHATTNPFKFIIYSEMSGRELPAMAEPTE